MNIHSLQVYLWKSKIYNRISEHPQYFWIRTVYKRVSEHPQFINLFLNIHSLQAYF
jgi:hypothetical protein